MRKILLSVIATFAFASCSSAPNVTSAEILEYGVFEKVSSHGQIKTEGVLSGKVQKGVNARLKEQTNTIVAALGTSFGVRLKLTGNPTGAVVNCSIRWIHPKLTNPSSGRASEQEQWRTQRLIGYPESAGYTFDNPWELVPGKWTIQVIYESKVLAEKTFSVVLPRQASNQSLQPTASRRTTQFPHD